MINYLYYIIATILTSFYIFPIEFVFLPTANTKMIMAVLGIPVLVFNMITHRKSTIPVDFINIGILAVLVSLVGVISISYNGTSDYTYATYFISFSVWSFAAYFVTSCIRAIHKRISVTIVCNYLIAVCTAQCVIAILIDSLPFLKETINSIVIGFGSMHSAGSGLEEANRLYGIGAALDVAGTRFSATLAITGILMSKFHNNDEKKIFKIYFIIFCILLIIGCMISRTTIIGLIICAVYWICNKQENNFSFLGHLVLLLTLATIAVVYLYHNNRYIHENLRFGFEFLFNWLERGEWSTNSTNILENMYKFPNNLKTWIIGDGYFKEPSISDPYYTGETRNWGEFYMGTDVGYIRFLYYFGTIGLLTFITYFLYITRTCINRFKTHKWIFYAILIANLIIWGKVATDIFCIFALFLMINPEDNNEYENLSHIEKV